MHATLAQQNICTDQIAVARIVQNAADARRGEKLVANKVFQLRLKEYGMLEAMQTYTRNQAAAQHIADMD